MVQRDDTQTITKRKKGGETSPPSQNGRYNFSERKQQAIKRSGKRKESYEDPLRIPDLATLEFLPFSEITMNDIIGNNDEYSNKFLKDDDIIVKVYNLLLNNIKKAKVKPKRLESILATESILRRCGMLITELHNIFPYVDAIGLFNEIDEPEINYYVTQSADMEFGTAQLAFLPGLKLYNRKLYDIFLVVLNDLMGRVNVLASNDDYEYDYARDYAEERFEELKCIKCKKKENLDEDEQQEIEALKVSIKLNGNNGLMQKYENLIRNAKGSLIEMLKDFNPITEMEHQCLSFFQLVEEISTISISVYDFSNYVYDRSDHDNGNPAMPHQVMRFIWDQKDWIWGETNNCLETSINMNGLYDPIFCYNIKQLSKERIEDDKKNALKMIKVMQKANQLCWYLFENIPIIQEKKYAKKCNAKTDTQLSCL